MPLGVARQFAEPLRVGLPAVRVGLERRVRGVAPGQSVVLYEGTRVVGSATISETGRA